MSEDSFLWILGIGGTIVAAIGGAFWRHVVTDADYRVKIAERIATLEARLWVKGGRERDDRD